MNVNGIRVDKFIHEMLPTLTALICQSKPPKVLMQSDMLLGLCNSAKQLNSGRWALSMLPYGTTALKIFAPKPEVCRMDGISCSKIDWRCSVGYGLVGKVKKKKKKKHIKWY